MLDGFDCKDIETTFAELFALGIEIESIFMIAVEGEIFIVNFLDSD
jgi:hypothetical protein